MDFDLLVVLLMLAGVAYWLDSIRSKEIAREAGKQACKKYELLFLDDTVVIEKVRLRRDARGRMKFFRKYLFEFTSDGENRYKGNITILGKLVQKIDMEAYQFDTG